MKTGVFAGSFDPVTDGHIDVMKRAAKFFDRLYVAVLINRGKTPLFTTEQRLALLRMAAEGYDNIEAASFDGLLVDFCRSVGADCIVRGLRSASDFETEDALSQINHSLSGMETVFFAASPEYRFISSSMLRDVALHGGDVCKLVRSDIADRMMQMLQGGESK